MNRPSGDLPGDYTPPLGIGFLTPAYDVAIAMLTRENRWRSLLLDHLSPQENDRILDIGSGTGRLADMLHATEPRVEYLGVDPDKSAVSIARKRALRRGMDAQFQARFFDGTETIGGKAPNKIVSSLVLHQTPLPEKRRIIQTAFDILSENGIFVVADYGVQSTALMRILFRGTVQFLDGVENTQHNAEGVLPKLFKEAGFSGPVERDTVFTPTGSIAIMVGRKAAN